MQSSWGLRSRLKTRTVTMPMEATPRKVNKLKTKKSKLEPGIRFNSVRLLVDMLCRADEKLRETRRDFSIEFGGVLTRTKTPVWALSFSTCLVPPRRHSWRRRTRGRDRFRWWELQECRRRRCVAARFQLQADLHAARSRAQFACTLPFL